MLSIAIANCVSQHNNTSHNVTGKCLDAECRYTVCHCAECCHGVTLLQPVGPLVGGPT